MATMKKEDYIKAQSETEAVAEGGSPEEEGDSNKVEVSKPENPDGAGTTVLPPTELPPLLSEEVQKEKDALLAEGFSDWSRVHYTAFIKASAKYGRSNVAKIAAEVGKSEDEVEKFVDAFWGDRGRERFSGHEYERVVNLVAKGEKKIAETKALERGTRVLISLFDNPWEELEFTHVNTKDKLFSADNDRYLLCWTHKYGYGQWGAIKMAIRRSPKFRFDYFLRSLPLDMIGRRCEHLMRAAMKEVEHLEKTAREEAGLPSEAEDGSELPPITLPKFKEIQKQMRSKKRQEREKERQTLEQKVEDLESQIKSIQERLKSLNKEPESQKENISRNGDSVKNRQPSNGETSSAPASAAAVTTEEEPADFDETKGAIGPDGEFVEFPEYDGSEPPKEAKKTFALFCGHHRKAVKLSLEPEERKDKQKVNGILKQRFMALSDEEKEEWRAWAAWDKKRFLRDQEIFEKAQQNEGKDGGKKRRQAENEIAVPKKRKKM